MKKSKGSLHLDSSLVLKFPSEDEEFLYFSLARRLKDPLAVSLKNFLDFLKSFTSSGTKVVFKICIGGKLKARKISLDKLIGSKLRFLPVEIFMIEPIDSAIASLKDLILNFSYMFQYLKFH